MTSRAELIAHVIEAVRTHPGLTIYRLARLLDIDEQTLYGIMPVVAATGQVAPRREKMSVRWYSTDGLDP